MANPTHTPGPWSLIEVEGKLCPAGEGGLSILTIVDEDGTNFAAVYEPADARMIAAAPDMLDALKLFVHEYVELVESGDAGFWDAEKEGKVIKARAAIAKAEGRS